METRDTKQYKIYTLHANVEVDLGEKDGKQVTRTDRVPVAVFTDKKALETYQAEEQSKLAGQKGYEVVEDWVEVEPAADGFSLPFNPLPNATVSDAEAVNDTKHNGDN